MRARCGLGATPALAVVCISLITMLWVTLTTQTLAAEEPIIAAASSLNAVIVPISQAFARHSGKRVRISFGASGSLSRQIAQGAPFELFLSADESYVRALQNQGLTTGSGVIYATGRLALFVPQGSRLLIDPTLDDLSSALGDSRLKRLAIANPEHAPYGRAAQQALVHRGLWQPIQGNLLFGENVAQTAQFTVSGADAGIISYSAALELAEAGKGAYILLPAAWHRPLHHTMVLLNPAGEVARAFYRYLQQPGAQRIFGKFGFLSLSTPQ